MNDKGMDRKKERVLICYAKLITYYIYIEEKEEREREKEAR